MAVAARQSMDREDLLNAVERALWRYEPVRSRDLPLSFDVGEDGRLIVRGYAPSRTIKEGILGVAASVEGVPGVVDEVHADPDLEVAIAQTLATEPSTKHLPPGAVQVFAQLGEIVLVGDLPESDRGAALGVAEGVPGVRTVVDRMSL